MGQGTGEVHRCARASEGLSDRQEDIWQPLFAVAALAGGDWPERARAAYIESIEKALPMLGTEYDYLNGPVLLRVSQDLTPTQAKGYQRALAKLKV